MLKFIFLLNFLVCAMLQGCLPTTIVSTTTGVAVAGADPRRFGGVFSDRRIKTLIQKAWLSESREIVTALDTLVWEGRVLVTGNIQSPALHAKAIQLVWTVRGVQEVMDHIELEGKSSLGNYASDTYIGTKIGTRLFFEKGVCSNNFGVRVQNAVVYMMGAATSQDELEHVMRVIQDISGVKKIISYVRLMSHEEAEKFLKKKKEPEHRAVSQELGSQESVI